MDLTRVSFCAGILIFCKVFCGSLSLTFDDCGSKHGNFSVVKLTGCDPATMDYCPLKKGKNTTIELTFVPAENLTEITVKVYGYIVGVPVPFALPNPNGCVDSGIKCPVASGSEVTYTVTMPIRQVYPKLKVDIRLELEDEQSEDAICVIIPAKIV
uniref:Niemann-Pick protein C2 n=1 Tax=Cyrtorhinus lividipennis TaxID=1032904 RepID=A0A346TI37_9HEMI|nr:Niemann-Pick protein C2 [Cyrtorhinus lividipennis]